MMTLGHLSVVLLLGFYCVVEMLIDSRANANAQVGDYGTALQTALARGYD
jgi:hypothetical protein